MSSTDPGGLGPGLKARLRAELDAVRPPTTPPRYLASRWSLRAWRLTPVALAVAFTGILALTAVAATGSPNPAVWTQRVETVINPPSPSPTNEESPAAPQSPTDEQAPPAHQESPEPSEGHETPTPAQPTESPEPAHDPSGEGSSQPSPSPTPNDH